MNYDQICLEVIKAVDSLAPAFSEVQDSPEKERLSDLRRDVESGFYSIVLLGEFNRGKSTILNALLARDLLPMDILPATAAIHILRFSRDPVMRVHWRDGRLENMALSAEALKGFASVESAQALAYLEIGVPSPILAGGVVFIDTPGVDDLNKQRAEVTYKFVPRSDTVIFVLDGTAAVRRTEAEFLESSILANGIERIVFLANFADLLDSDEGEGPIPAIRNRLAAALGGGDRPVFLVSARQALQARLTRDEKQWKESGFPAFVDFLEKLKAEGPHSIAKAKQYVHRAQAIVSGIAADVERICQLNGASDIDLQQYLTALVRVCDAAQARRDKIGQWTSDREREILAIVGKSSSSFGEQLEEDIRDLVQEYSGPQFQQFVQERIPGMVRRQVKAWAESHTSAVTRLLAQLHRELSAALEREFRRELSIPSYDRAPIEISQTAFSIFADDVSGSYIKAGVWAAGAASLLMVAGAPLLIPLVAMAGLPFLQGEVLKHQLNTAKANALPEVTKALRDGMTAFSEGLQNALRAEIREIRSAAESVYDSQMALEQQRVEREMAKRQSERSEIRHKVDVTTSNLDLVKRIGQDLEALMHSISEEVLT